MKNLSALFLFLFFGLSLKAQTHNLSAPLPHIEESSRKHFILEVGYAGSMSTDEDSSAQIQHGISGGLLFDVYGEHYYTIETGLSISQQNFGYSSPTSTSVETVTGANDLSHLQDIKIVGKLTYVGIPILIKLNLAGRVINTPFVIAGVSPQFLIEKDISVQGSDSNGNIQSVKPSVTDYNPPSYDVTSIVGIGGAFKFSQTKTLLLQATYNRGFIPIDYLSQGICNQSFLLTVGFGVDL